MMSEPIHILILEDNPTDAELIQYELQEAGISFTAKVLMAEKDYIGELNQSPPDLILSDYDLPTYSGALALAETKRRCPDIPFILVTGAVVEDYAIEILTQGAKDYVLKAQLEKRLAPAVRRALAQAQEQKAHKRAEAELVEAHKALEAMVAKRTAELTSETAARKKLEQVLRQIESREGSPIASLRKQAEARVKASKAASDLSGLEADSNKLIQELHIHQIELEMQNEELRKSREGVEALLDKYTGLYDFAPVGYFNLGSDGTIRQVNLTGAKLLLNERARPIKDRFGNFVSPDDRRRFNEFLQRIFTKRAAMSDREVCEVMLDDKRDHPSSPGPDGRPSGDVHRRHVHIEARTTRDGQECLLAVVDITEHKRAQEALVEAHRRLVQALDELTTLRDIIPLCSRCRKIRDDQGYLNQVEQYVNNHTDTEFSYGVCPECFKTKGHRKQSPTP